MSVSICVYAICKDEAKFAERWAKSMGEADRVVCLDTGSSDGTADILRENGVEVSSATVSPWRFDTARNVSLDMALATGCDVYVCTDLDEYFLPGWADAIREAWDPATHTRAWYRYDWARSERGERVCGFTYDKVHDASWRWAYPVHETLVRDGSPDYPEGEVCRPGFDRVHLVHTQDLGKDRKSYLPLLKLRIEENPSDPYGRVYMAREYLMARRYDEAIGFVDECLSSDVAFSDENKSRLLQYKAEALWDADDSAGAIEACMRANKLDRLAREPLVLMARIHIDDGDFALAKGSLEQALRDSVRRNMWFEVNSYWTWETYCWLGVCCWNLGEYLEAAGWFAMALSEAPEEKILRDDLEMAVESLKGKLGQGR